MKLAEVKIIFLGDQNVGKSSLINRYMEDTFSPSENPTYSGEFYVKRLTIDQINISM